MEWSDIMCQFFYLKTLYVVGRCYASTVLLKKMYGWSDTIVCVNCSTKKSVLSSQKPKKYNIPENGKFDLGKEILVKQFAIVPGTTPKNLILLA